MNLPNPVVFPYPGSKWREMKHILPLLPDHDHFVVPFGGSGAEILAKPPSKIETFNDLDDDIYNVFKIIREGDVLELKRRLFATPRRCWRTYDEARQILLNGSPDPLARAWAYLVVQWCGWVRGSAGREHDQFAIERTKTRPNAWSRLPYMLDFVRRRFMYVQLLKGDYWPVMNRTDSPRTVFLIDPPYHPHTLNSSSKLYRHDLTENDHEVLLERIDGVEGLVVLCGYANNALYEREVKHWRRIDIPMSKLMTAPGIDRQHAIETLWLNFNEKGVRL